MQQKLIKMAKDPAFLFYSDNFQTGTQFFTDEQCGKYIRLLCAQHLHGHLTEKQMMFICKTYDEEVFQKFVKDDNGLFYNERLEEEILKRKNYSKSRSDNKKGKTIQPKSEISYDNHMGNGNGNEIRNEIRNEVETKNFHKHFELAKSEYIEIYKHNFSAPPTFGKFDDKDINSICKRVQENMINRGISVTADTFKQTIRGIFVMALTEKWLKANYTPSNIEKRIDQIINNAKKSYEQHNYIPSWDRD